MGQALFDVDELLMTLLDERHDVLPNVLDVFLLISPFSPEGVKGFFLLRLLN